MLSLTQSTLVHCPVFQQTEHMYPTAAPVMNARWEAAILGELGHEVCCRRGLNMTLQEVDLRQTKLMSLMSMMEGSEGVLLPHEARLEEVSRPTP
jgi:hypothetical protein